MRGLAPFPYFGSKAAVAAELWDAFGHDVPNFVDPFCGSCAVLWARPAAGKIETVNDAHAFIPNFLRAVKAEPELVAEHALWPVSEIDMHARHAALLDRATEEWRERLREDADYYDAQMAGWWVWGASIWIGSGWCDAGVAQTHKRPAIGGRGARPSGKNGAKSGVGIFRNLKRQVPLLSGSDGSGVGYGRGIFGSGRREDLCAYFRSLAARLTYVRITAGDWSRVVTPAVTVSHGTTAILLDPPYAADRTVKLYAKDSMAVSADVRAWALDHGEDRRYRIALCGYEGEHDMPDSWRCFSWKAGGGYGNQDGENRNASRERIWFSPWCLGGDRVAGPLFATMEATDG